MHCLSHRVRRRAVVSLGAVLAASVLMLASSGAYAGVAALRSEDVVMAPEDEPTIVFAGGAMAPLVCSSTPDTTAMTIADDTRVTLANLTGADASVDTGTAQTVAVADGVGVSVKFRPGQYTVRMVPDCTVTNAVDAALLTVTDAAAPATATTRPSRSEPEVMPAGSSPSVPMAESSVGEQPRIGEPLMSPAGTTASAAPGRSRAPFVGGGPASTPAPTPSPPGSPAAAGATSSGPTPPAASGSAPLVAAASPDSVIYDVVTVAVPQPGDPRDSRLLAVVAVICVFGVTTAIIRAILSQRARRMVST